MKNENINIPYKIFKIPPFKFIFNTAFDKDDIISYTYLFGAIEKNAFRYRTPQTRMNLRNGIEAVLRQKDPS